MKFIKNLGGFSSEVNLVEIDGVKYVLKKADYGNIVTEKIFQKRISELGVPSLKFFDNLTLKDDEMLLEYIPDSNRLSENLTENNCRQWGTITRKIHDVKFKSCFRYDNHSDIVAVTWSKYLASKIKQAFSQAKENNNYGFNSQKINDIKEFLAPLSKLKPRIFSLVHGDFHSGNVLLRKNELIPFDKNPEIFSGDPLLDLAVIIVDMPNGTLIHTTNSKNVNDKKYFQAFLQGYKDNFLNQNIFYRYVMLIAFGRLYTPFSENYPAIIDNLLK